MTNTEKKSNITTIKFALHPNITLRVSLHKSISINPHHQIVNKLLALPKNANSEKFVIIDAKNIVSMDQFAIAANTALLRIFQFEQKNANSNGNGTSSRGLGLETILCCAGSTNTASVMKDYAFDKNSIAAQQQETDNSAVYDIFCLSYCESEEEHEEVTKSLELGDAECTTSGAIEAYFSRPRSDKEMNALFKVYKLTKDEVEMHGSSLEKAVCNRVAAKFYI